jgi:hypothetical protein
VRRLYRHLGPSCTSVNGSLISPSNRLRDAWMDLWSVIREVGTLPGNCMERPIGGVLLIELCWVLAINVLFIYFVFVVLVFDMLYVVCSRHESSQEDI